MRLAAATVAFLALAAPASANEFQTLYNDFKGDGAIDPCRYSAGELQQGASQIPPDIEQYAPSFADQLAAARQGQAGGRCGAGAATTERAAAAQQKAAPSSSGRRRGNVAKPPAPKRTPEPTLAGVPSPNVSASAAGAAGTDAPAPVWILAGLA